MAHYFDIEPETEAGNYEIDFNYAEKKLKFYSSDSVFSKKHVDEGSIALLDGIRSFYSKSDENLTGQLVDMGCGYGVLGISLKRLFPSITPVLVDVNRRALSLAKENYRLNGLAFTEVIESDAWTKLQDYSFDIVVSNPPIRAGKAKVHEILAQSYEHLKAKGRIFTVLAKKQGADSAKKLLVTTFGNCTTIHRSKGFHVLTALKN